MLVDDMAEIRWRRMRLLRAEAGLQASRKRRFELNRQWAQASASRVEAASLTERWQLAQGGLSALSGSSSRFDATLEMLKGLRASVELYGFGEEDRGLLEVIYGSEPGITGMVLKADFEHYMKAEDTAQPAEQKAHRESFLRKIDEEIESFQKRGSLTLQRDVEVTEPMKDAQLLPRQKDLE